MVKLGILSDTHGLLRPEVLHLLKGVELIIHAGDIGSKKVLEALDEIAPVHAVRGNVDTESWTLQIPERAHIEVDGFRILVIHQLEHINREPDSIQPNAVVSGHSHKPSLSLAGEQNRLNPGSAGRQRFHLPVSLVLADIHSGSLFPTFINLLTGKPFTP